MLARFERFKQRKLRYQRSVSHHASCKLRSQPAAMAPAIGGFYVRPKWTHVGSPIYAASKPSSSSVSNPSLQPTASPPLGVVRSAAELTRWTSSRP